MGNLFHLGSNWVLLWAVLLAVHTFAEFSTTDSANLANIRSDVNSSLGKLEIIDSDLVAVKDLVRGIKSTSEDIYSDVHDLVTYAGDTAFYSDSINDTLEAFAGENGIFVDRVIELQDTLDDINTQVQQLAFVDSHYSQQALLVKEDNSDALLSNINVIGHDVTNQLSRLKSNTFTNFVSNLAFIPYVNSNEPQLKRLFRDLYGFEPNSTELSNFRNQQTYGPTLQHYYDFAKFIPIDDQRVKDKFNTYYTLQGQRFKPYLLVSSYYGAVKQYASVTAMNDISAHALMYEYLYGTRALTDTVVALSNSLMSVEGDGEYISRSPSGGVSMGGVSHGILSGISESASFTDVVKTNIVGEVLAGVINPLADNDFAREFDKVQDADPSKFTELDDAVTEIESYQAPIDDFSEMLSSSDTQDDYTFPIQAEMLNSGVQDISIKVTNFSAYTSAYMSVICNSCCLFIVLFFFARAWKEVVEPMPLFFAGTR